MNDAKKMLQEISALGYPIRKILKAAQMGSSEVSDWSREQESTDDPDEAYLKDQVQYILNYLEKINNELEYMEKPIREEGILSKNSSGRYEISDNYELTSGSSIEVLINDDWDECQKWVITRVEHTNGDYYFYDLKNVPMAGARVRRR